MFPMGKIQKNCKKDIVLLRFELRLLESEPRVMTNYTIGRCAEQQVFFIYNFMQSYLEQTNVKMSNAKRP